MAGAEAVRRRLPPPHRHNRRYRAAKAFAVGRPVADRHGDLGAIIGRPAALGLVISHAGFRKLGAGFGHDVARPSIEFGQPRDRGLLMGVGCKERQPAAAPATAFAEGLPSSSLRSLLETSELMPAPSLVDHPAVSFRWGERRRWRRLFSRCRLGLTFASFNGFSRQPGIQIKKAHDKSFEAPPM
jgi:hypothetical protein